MRAMSEGKEKLDTRWEDGVFAGVREKSGEIYVMSTEGVRNVRSYQRRPENTREDHRRPEKTGNTREDQRRPDKTR